ncbi:ABC transporter permease [Syntrophorhabdus aromaticivorans]|jgi:putative ABC transport system permease protein|uniref:ABC transporter permease n=1 Tax=Syntrophorhabdus aromaticivorans TaxID=328301 RepID=UPI0003FE69C9|nr:ABC transporter permease [Syntrophorhabdus aromaticivorans]HBA54961.1 multidrug ABC transporter substrate-binding protein [Syntrophorhabdus aromaticivorans]
MIWNALILALRAISRNKMRSFLTILGIVIGVAAVITLVTVGGGATAKVTEDIAKLGSNLLMVTPGQMRGGGGGHGEAKAFEMDDAKAIAREVSSLVAVAPTSSSSAMAVYGSKSWSTSVTGIDNGYFKVKDWAVENGREFSDGEVRSGTAVCILGTTVKKELFGEQEPVGQRIRVKGISFQVVGILSAKGQSTTGRDQDDLVIMPLRTFQRRISGNEDIGLIQVSVEEGASTEKVQQDIEGLLRERRRISNLKGNDFQIRDMKELAGTLLATTQLLTTLLGAVAAVSLLVGGIGIMNIMLVSVTERTREIGTRLAIGALEREVLLQFLVEAIVLSAFGGLFGIILALIASAFLVRILEVPFVLNMGIIIIAFLFSGAVGLIFGYVPAHKAAGLDPIEALRHE